MKFEIPKNYVISYNPEKNYNEVDSTYLPPYRSNSHPSIYEGVTVEMHIVNHCNINCNCCNHFSPLADPWFITVDFFKEQVQLLKDNVSSLKEFLILGGEPLLHPDILTLCKIARTILGPNIIINVLTNGTLVNKIKEEEQQYSEMEIKFIFTSYKNYSDKMMKDISIGEIHYTRTLSKQTLVECSGSLNGFNNFFNCTNHQLPCLTLKNSKLYICPFCAHIDSFCKKNNIVITEKEWVDFIPLDKLNNELDKLQTFCFTPKNYCNYCVQNTEAVPFTKSKKDIIEFTIPLYELYFRDYERYEQVINANNGHIEWCLSEDNLGKIDYRFHTHTLETEILRYKNAKIDLIIPYFNETKDQLIALYENLKMQTAINNCMIYLISDGSNMDRFVLNLFKDLHCVFLRNKIQKGPGAARNKGIVNSFSQHILFMDADDLFINNQALEKLIEATQNVQLLSF